MFKLFVCVVIFVSLILNLLTFSETYMKHYIQKLNALVLNFYTKSSLNLLFREILFIIFPHG